MEPEASKRRGIGRFYRKARGQLVAVAVCLVLDTIYPVRYRWSGIKPVPLCGTCRGVPYGTTRVPPPYLVCLALRPSYSAIIVRTGESWLYIIQQHTAAAITLPAGATYISRTLRAIALCLLTLPLGGLGCPVLTTHLLFMFRPCYCRIAVRHRYCSISIALYYLKTNSIYGA